jgi:hypothetical protein
MNGFKSNTTDGKRTVTLNSSVHGRCEVFFLVEEKKLRLVIDIEDKKAELQIKIERVQ